MSEYNMNPSVIHSCDIVRQKNCHRWKASMVTSRSVKVPSRSVKVSLSNDITDKSDELIEWT